MKAPKTSGGSVQSGLSSKSGMGDYAKGDDKDRHLPKKASDHSTSVKKAGKTFTIDR